MQASSHVPFSRLCFRLSPKCLLAPNVSILKSMFHPASCSALDQDSVKWTDAFSFVLSNRTCACNCVSCQGAHWPLMCHQHTYKRGKRDKRCSNVLTLTHPISSVSSRMTHGDSSTPTRSSKLWATCCVLGMACIRRWAWQTCGWPSSAWLWVLLATPCLWATPQHWSNLWTHLDGSTRRRWVGCCVADIAGLQYANKHYKVVVTLRMNSSLMVIIFSTILTCCDMPWQIWKEKNIIVLS